jgi:hypothetical protein
VLGSNLLLFEALRRMFGLRLIEGKTPPAWAEQFSRGERGGDGRACGHGGGARQEVSSCCYGQEVSTGAASVFCSSRMDQR